MPQLHFNFLDLTYIILALQQVNNFVNCIVYKNCR